jgi:hypothetical protein
VVVDDRSADGRSFEIGSPSLRLRCTPPPVDGVELELEVDGAGAVAITVEDRTYGLPEIDPPLAPRPADTMAKPFRVSDLTIVERTVEL